MPKVALFDLDGTLADYNGQMASDLHSIESPDELSILPSFGDKHPEYLENRRQMISRQFGWWESLPRIEYVFDLYYYLFAKGYCVNIATKGPSTKSHAWAEKLNWCRANTPEANVTITEDKSLLYGKILVDDYPGYAEKWLEYRPRGLVVMPEYNYNKGFDHPQVVKFNSGNLEKVKERINELVR